MVVDMKLMCKPIIKICLTLSFIGMFLTACSRQSGESEKAEEENMVYCRIQETTIPDPDEALTPLLKEEGFVRELSFRFSGSRVYRLAQLWEKVDGMDLTQGYCMQILEAPYKEWKNYEVDSKYWNSEAVDFVYYNTEHIYNIGVDGEVYCRVQNCYFEGEEVIRDYYLGAWNAAGEGKLLCGMSDSLMDKNIFMLSNGEAVAFAESDSILVSLGEGLQEKQRYTVQGQVRDILQNPVSGDIFWYGTSEKGLGVWSINDNVALLENFEDNADIDSFAVFSDNGELYVADRKNIWRCNKQEEPTLLCNFFERDYILRELFGISVQTDGAVLLLAEYEDAYHIVSVQETDEVQPNKQEIVLAITSQADRVSNLNQAITKFNRQNDLYCVKLLTPQSDVDYQKFINRIQLEVTAGGGPDILSYEVIDPISYARNGYLQNVEGMLEEEEEYWQAAMDCGIIDGARYGVPYECGLQFAAYSQALTDGRSRWSLSEMMEAVRSSEAVMLSSGLGGMEIVWYYGLLDNDNRSFIDWEKGESHLTEEPFLELLDFAKKYADQGEYTGEDAAVMLWDGKIATQSPTTIISGFGQLNYLEACFQGEPSYIGFPREKGNGIYIFPYSLYLNSASDKAEGCKAFFNFLLSEEVQNSFVKMGETLRPGESISRSRFAVRLSALERSINLERAAKQTEEVVLADGIEYNMRGMSEEQEQRFRYLIENARPNNWYALDIMDVVWEELEPYFEGQRSAEEAARILDNRVQLYLDERK